MAISAKIIKNIDWFTILIYVILVSVGWLNIFASAHSDKTMTVLNFTEIYGKQFIWIISGFFIAFLIILVDSRFFPAFAYYLYGLSIVLLIGVLIFGSITNNSQSWFEIGDFKLQPSEFAKFTTALALASLVNSTDFKISYLKNIVSIIAIIATPAIFILVQNDTGSALVYLAFVLVLYREGLSGMFLFFGALLVSLFVASFFIRTEGIILGLFLLGWIANYMMRRKTKELIWSLGLLTGTFGIPWLIVYLLNYQIEASYLATFSALTISLVYLLYSYKNKIASITLIVLIFLASIGFVYSVDYIFNNILEKHQQTRINILLGLEEDPKGAGYNVNQSKIAIGSGGWTGKGFLQGTQTKYDFVPEQSTDFIFCTIGEEWGFVGASVLIILFVVLMTRLVVLAERQRSPFSRVFGYSVVCIIFFHFMVNIGMTIGLLPVVGIPLPFISYGGSSLWTFTLLLFVFLRLDISREDLL